MPNGVSQGEKPTGTGYTNITGAVHVKTIAYFDSSHDMPEEVIDAAGFIPVKIMGDVHKSNDPADQYLPKFFCPAARSWLTEALSRSGDWEGIVFAHGCDATNRHFDVWKLHVQTPFLYWFNSPIKTDAVAARFFRKELERLIAALEKQFGTQVMEECLREALRKSNEVKKRLRELSALRSTKDVSNREYLEIITHCLSSSKDASIAALDSALNEWKSRGPFPAGKRRFYLTGSDITYPEFMDLLDECGIRVVRDDLSLGERYFATSFTETGDPLNAIVDYYMNIPRPATKLSIGGRVDFILKSLEETPVDAVLSQNLKFCEPYAYDSVIVNDEIREKGFRVLHLEREFTPVTDHQVMNRITAFTEML